MDAPHRRHVRHLEQRVQRDREKGGDRVVDRSGHPPVRHPRNRTDRGPGSEGGKDGRWKKYAEQYKQQRPDDQVNASLFAHDEYLCCP